MVTGWSRLIQISYASSPSLSLLNAFICTIRLLMLLHLNDRVRVRGQVEDGGENSLEQRRHRALGTHLLGLLWGPPDHQHQKRVEQLPRRCPLLSVAAVVDKVQDRRQEGVEIERYHTVARIKISYKYVCICRWLFPLRYADRSRLSTMVQRRINWMDLEFSQKHQVSSIFVHV